MAKAIVTRRFDATDAKKGVSRRIEPSPKPQTLPAWVAEIGVRVGSAERVEPKHDASPSLRGGLAEKPGGDLHDRAQSAVQDKRDDGVGQVGLCGLRLGGVVLARGREAHDTNDKPDDE